MPTVQEVNGARHAARPWPNVCMRWFLLVLEVVSIHIKKRFQVFAFNVQCHLCQKLPQSMSLIFAAADCSFFIKHFKRQLIVSASSLDLNIFLYLFHLLPTGVKWRMGMWSKDEVKLLKENIDKYCKVCLILIVPSCVIFSLITTIVIPYIYVVYHLQ